VKRGVLVEMTLRLRQQEERHVVPGGRGLPAARHGDGDDTACMIVRDEPAEVHDASGLREAKRNWRSQGLRVLQLGWMASLLRASGMRTEPFESV